MQIQAILSMQGISTNIISLRENTDVSTLINHINRTMTPICGIVLDYDCVKSDDFIQQSSYNNLFNTKNKWLIFEEIDNKTESLFLSQLARTHLYVNAEISYLNIRLGFFNETSQYVWN